MTENDPAIRAATRRVWPTKGATRLAQREAARSADALSLWICAGIVFALGAIAGGVAVAVARPLWTLITR